MYISVNADYLDQTLLRCTVTYLPGSERITGAADTRLMRLYDTQNTISNKGIDPHKCNTIIVQFKTLSMLNKKEEILEYYYI